MSVQYMKNLWPMLVATLELKGGLNQVMSVFRLCLVYFDHGSWYFSSSVWPLFLSAVSYSCFVSRNASLLLRQGA